VTHELSRFGFLNATLPVFHYIRLVRRDRWKLKNLYHSINGIEKGFSHDRTKGGVPEAYFYRSWTTSDALEKALFSNREFYLRAEFHWKRWWARNPAVISHHKSRIPWLRKSSPTSSDVEMANGIYYALEHRKSSFGPSRRLAGFGFVMATTSFCEQLIVG
jgi:hypothetical protein